MSQSFIRSLHTVFIESLTEAPDAFNVNTNVFNRTEVGLLVTADGTAYTMYTVEWKKPAAAVPKSYGAFKDTRARRVYIWNDSLPLKTAQAREKRKALATTESGGDEKRKKIESVDKDALNRDVLAPITLDAALQKHRAQQYLQTFADYIRTNLYLEMLLVMNMPIDTQTLRIVFMLMFGYPNTMVFRAMLLLLNDYMDAMETRIHSLRSRRTLNPELVDATEAQIRQHGTLITQMFYASLYGTYSESLYIENYRSRFANHTETLSATDELVAFQRRLVPVDKWLEDPRFDQTFDYLDHCRVGMSHMFTENGARRPQLSAETLVSPTRADVGAQWLHVQTTQNDYYVITLFLEDREPTRQNPRHRDQMLVFNSVLDGNRTVKRMLLPPELIDITLYWDRAHNKPYVPVLQCNNHYLGILDVNMAKDWKLPETLPGGITADVTRQMAKDLDMYVFAPSIQLFLIDALVSTAPASHVPYDVRPQPANDTDSRLASTPRLWRLHYEREEQRASSDTTAEEERFSSSLMDPRRYKVGYADCVVELPWQSVVRSTRAHGCDVHFRLSDDYCVALFVPTQPRQSAHRCVTVVAADLKSASRPLDPHMIRTAEMLRNNPLRQTGAVQLFLHSEAVESGGGVETFLYPTIECFTLGNRYMTVGVNERYLYAVNVESLLQSTSDPLEIEKDEDDDEEYNKVMVVRRLIGSLVAMYHGQPPGPALAPFNELMHKVDQRYRLRTPWLSFGGSGDGSENYVEFDPRVLQVLRQTVPEQLRVVQDTVRDRLHLVYAHPDDPSTVLRTEVNMALVTRELRAQVPGAYDAGVALQATAQMHWFPSTPMLNAVQLRDIAHEDALSAACITPFLGSVSMPPPAQSVAATKLLMVTSVRRREVRLSSTTGTEPVMPVEQLTLSTRWRRVVFIHSSAHHLTLGVVNSDSQLILIAWHYATIVEPVPAAK